MNSQEQICFFIDFLKNNLEYNIFVLDTQGNNSNGVFKKSFNLKEITVDIELTLKSGKIVKYMTDFCWKT